ncbi:Two-component response regulator-like APRR1 [Gracilariopsis chorda]|uniref:Two-component response regulator-like APRR1 n=1 Tax=Gracilariopsis chorda TaxID=448386 RepID=A0A2V3IVZ6_9FLOR|nr:Two-component response regulator-like APRR1 [Gracilariopsis chorda]|eukprot:PXF46302.1 Two-component response regulator-like APRR1 [Gracilariopsis chorda]
MGSGTTAAAPPLSRISSETNLAVQLLLAVSDARHCRPSTQHGRPHSSSATSSDMPADLSDDSDSIDSTPTSAQSPALRQKITTPPSTSPRGVPPTFARGDATFFKYTREERQEALKRFREKKRRRQFRKRVRYMVRKRLAETRPRYKGRFSKPPPGETYDDGTPGPPPKSQSTKQTTSSAKDHTASKTKDKPST